ncbi:hypothetical protein SAMN04488120_101116 [Fontimonas thermophila]|uniref:Uncharacterized protein n=1 Tax=Fontimonas thermophila TaxID=1076937 RepID=A0A1I2H3Y3_9GAMM|nr:hypothetical protein [Fontimonas thermophila]SFF24080.1 hypothetical protein SAMN04488120_101116 [Fontimonas thermophila]
MPTFLKAFVAGFGSTLLFHQGLLAVLHGAGWTARAPWNLAPVPPLGVPSVISLAFWGGLWGIALWAVIARSGGARQWVLALTIGALAPSLVAWFVVMPLKGMGPAGGFDPSILIGALLLNGAWGLGVALIMRLFRRHASG